MIAAQVEKGASRVLLLGTVSSYLHGFAAAWLRGHTEPYLADWAGNVAVTSLVSVCCAAVCLCILALR